MKQRTPFRRIDCMQAEALFERNDLLILDARDARAYAESHIDGAQPVSSANLSSHLSNTAKTRPILIYCYHGNASQEYGQIFADFAFAEVYSLDGGYEAWRARPATSPGPAIKAALQEWLVAHQFPPAGVNAVIANHTTPLMKAAHGGNDNIIRLLITAGALLNVQNADGNNALWLACVGGHLDTIDLLIDAGIEIDNRNVNGATALMYAASSGKADVVKRLLAKGADVLPETPDGFSALDLASTVDCLVLLRQKRAAAPDSAKTASGI